MSNRLTRRLDRLFSFACILLVSGCISRIDLNVDDAGTSASGGSAGSQAGGGSTGFAVSGGTAPAGTGGTTVADAGGSVSPDAAINQQLMSRWNQAADGLVGTFTFHWSQFDQFPHPTYKGGTAEAYQAFAQVLLAFLQQGDDFDFLKSNDLIDLHLVYVFPSGQNGLDTSFRQLITDFSSGMSWANISCATRNALRPYANNLAGTTVPPDVCGTGINVSGTGGATSVVIGTGGSSGSGGSSGTPNGIQCGENICSPGWYCCLPTLPRCAPVGAGCDL